MSRKLIAFMMACMLLVLAACGSSQNKPAEGSDSQIIVAEEGQNPVMNFVGNYQADRASMLVEAEGAENAKFTVNWGSSAWENSEWVMSGKLDRETLSVTYDNCVRTDRVYGDDGSVTKETVVFENGKGRISFNAKGNSITWEDDQEHIADGKVFSFVPARDRFHGDFHRSRSLHHGHRHVCRPGGEAGRADPDGVSE